MDIFNSLIHIDQYLVPLVINYGEWIYFILFLIIFCETGLVVTPFLPGDSLLFVAGTLAAKNAHGLNICWLFALLTTASILGNQLNYQIGRLIGDHAFKKNSFFFNKKHLLVAHHFYEKHGGKTIIFARFIPVIRTFVPFVAGIGSMAVKYFLLYNVTSAFLWIGSLLAAGYLLGTIPLVKANYSLFIYGIIGISILPPIIIFLYKKAFSNKNALSS